jgi:NAD(P)-dependent dehydrogenase (short-subunit alcohol dehydrogenase family)
MNGISFSVRDKHVLISGGSGGIGSAFAHAFLQHGAQVTVTDLKPPPDDVLRAGARFEALDVTNDEAVLALAKKIDTLDVLIHCAGKLKRWEEHQPEVFREIVDIHLFGNVRLAAAFRPHLKQTRGCLINIASMYSYFGAPQVPAYAAAKTAVVGLTRALAMEFVRKQITVNAICPGYVSTDLLERTLDNIVQKTGSSREQAAAHLRSTNPQDRFVEPEEVAAMVRFLCLPGSESITGQSLALAGGEIQ